MAETTPATGTKTTSAKEKNTVMALIAYILFFVPLLTDAKDDPFVKFHVKQSIILVIGWVISQVLWVIPILGWIAAPIVGIALFVFWIIGVLNALNGQEKELPIIGQYAKKLTF